MDIFIKSDVLHKTSFNHFNNNEYVETNKLFRYNQRYDTVKK